MALTEFGKIRKEFSENTSCHGLAQVYISANKVQRFFWILLCLTVFGALISQLAVRLQEYASYSTTTSTAEKFVHRHEFPAVTICNFNHFFNVEDGAEREATEELAKASSGFNQTSINHTRVAYFDGVNEGSLRKYSLDKGWQLTDNTLVWCYYADQGCSVENLTSSVSEMGKCWTFSTSVPIVRSGSKHGLYMIVDVNQDQYSEGIYYGNWEAGIRVQVHPKYDEPQVDELGMAIPVGHVGFISLHRKEEEIMYKPWGECLPDKEKLTYYRDYSEANCFRECLRNILEIHCNCTLYMFNHTSEVPECTPAQSVWCLHESATFIDQLLTAELCDCQPACKSTVYQPSISYASLPNKIIEESIIKVLTSINASSDYLSRNLAGMSIFFDRMSYTKQTESKSMTWSALLSDCGGQLGLWMGISVVTLFEFVQFLTTYIVQTKKSKKTDEGATHVDRERSA